MTPSAHLAAYAADASVAHRQAERPIPSPVLGREIFREALVRERRRADRTNQPFALFLVTIGTNRLSSRAVIAALTAAKRASDVLGWFSARSLGLIVPEIATEDAAVLDSIKARLEAELVARVPATALAGVAVEMHLHAPSKTAETPKVADRLIAQRRPSGAGAGLKRGLDLLGSVVLLALLMPVLLVIAALVRFGSTGPVLFRQERVGQHGKRFNMLKFRTMRVGADPALHHAFMTQFIKASADLEKRSNEAPFKITNDPRVTSMGRFLRKTSLDEVPQLWNVVKGEMSLVGPRPPLPFEVEQYQPWHCRRVLDAKPGMTGLWQVKGRSRTTFDEMVRLDLRYAKSVSIWTDFKILLATPAAVIGGKGAA